MSVSKEKAGHFRERVLRVVAKIPQGATKTYKQVAREAGNERAARAVGAVLHTNYKANVPCHRVVCSDGTLGGYNRGRSAKARLLRKERQ